MIEDSLVLSILASGVAHCQTVATEHGGLLSSLFAAGLFGSFTHCVGMCGPFVLSQTMTRLEAVPAAQMREFHRLAGAALIPYHLGRMTTYISLGMILSALADGMIAASGMKWLSAALLILAALFFTGYGLRKLNVTFPWKIGSWAGPSPRWLASITRPLFQRPVGWRGFALGIALGFLPCGLLYGALAASAASGSVVAGGLGMLAFALGTIPALIAVGVAGHTVGGHWRGATAMILPLLMILNAMALTYFAWRIVA